MSLDDPTSGGEASSNILPFSDGGRVFCFLPLSDDGSNGTGFPVHVNGSFALESNRKHLKWPSSSSYTAPYGSAGAPRKPADEHLDRRLLWNQCLLSEALPYAYSGMLTEAIRLHSQQLQSSDSNMTDSSSWCSSAATIYRAVPDFSRVDRRWDAVLPVLFNELFKQASVFAPASGGGGQWIEPRLAVFDTLANSATDSDVADIVVAVLREAGVKVTDAPAHVQLAIRRSCRFNPTEITPTVVSAAVRTVQVTLNC
jgi:sacsin